MRRLLKLLTSRLFWAALAIVIQFMLFAYLVFWASFMHSFYFYVFFSLLSVVMSFAIFTRNEDPSYKLVWMFLIAILPVFGGVLYLVMANKKLGYFSRKKTQQFRKTLPDSRPYAEAAEAKLDSIAPEYRKLSSFIKNRTGLSAWMDTECRYFAYADEFFIDVLSEVRKASKFIFIEYFIIGEGHWWSILLDELVRKVESGVDVRVIYDDLGSINSLPAYYDRKLSALGIKAVAFNRVHMHMNPRLNFRDHRKIFCIDGNICYTGGLNISDEYSNDEIRFGYWKDNAVKFKGAAVWNFTYLFLEMWMGIANAHDNLRLFIPTVSGRTDGFIQPFGDSPLDSETITKDVYLQIIADAKDYVWIMTPYLVPDSTFISTLRMAAQSGVDVRIITPHYPDKKSVFEVTRSNYLPLLEAGVRIFEYTPGFIHSKTFIADDEVAIVGTTNIDYRSFYLHFELSVLFVLSSIVSSVKDDFLKTFDMSEEQSIEMVSRIGPVKRLVRYFLRLFSPAL